MEKTIVTIKKIKVIDVDNELYILASTNAGSSEICHIKSGYFKEPGYVVYPGAILPVGEYDLTIIGINWGGPQAFNVVLTTVDDEEIELKMTAEEANSEAVGATWCKTIKITISGPPSD